jgi:glycosyltransferase involved in cell wall biosynthesis
MACGCPVIVSKPSSLPEVCGDAAYYVNPCDIEQIADALRVVTTVQGVSERLIQKGFEQVKFFSWDKTAQGIFQVIKSVGSSRR